MNILSPSRSSGTNAFFAWLLLPLALGLSACTGAETKVAPASPQNSGPSAETAKGPAIEITPEGPADTVRAFYDHLRNKRFREAIFLTDLRPAVEGLTENELKDFAIDFETLARQVPAVVEINGEIISGESATVTARLPRNDTGESETQPIRLRRQRDVWIITTAGEDDAKKIAREGKDYFYNLRIATHEQEAQKMLERVSKAQMAHSLQNGGVYTDMRSLIGAGLLPDDITSSESTGYNYSIELAGGGSSYTAHATPADYPRSGKRSFALALDGSGLGRVTGKDNGGKPLGR